MINPDTRADAQAIAGFTENLRTAYYQLAAMRDKIAYYADSLEAIQGNTANARQVKFAQIVGLLIGEEDIVRLATFRPTLIAFLEHIEANLSDFIID